MLLPSNKLVCTKELKIKRTHSSVANTIREKNPGWSGTSELDANDSQK